jgi:hypothetical protein
MMADKEKEWVVVVAAGVDPHEPRSHLRCDRCGERGVIELPVRVDTWVAMAKGFEKVHRQCLPKEAACTS